MMLTRPTRKIMAPTFGAFLLACATAPAMAQDAFEEDGFSLGAGVAFSSSPFVGADDNELSFLPLISFDKGPFHIGFDGASFTAVDRERWSFTLLAAPRMSDADSVDSPFLTGIDRDIAFELGAQARYDLSGMYIGAKALHDVTGEHGGFELTATAGKEFAAGPFLIDLAVGAAYRDADLNEYLYGVKAAEARADRAAYRPGGDVTPFVEASVTYPIGDRMAFIGFAGYELFSNEVRDSPLIEENGQATIGLAFVRKF